MSELVSVWETNVGKSTCVYGDFSTVLEDVRGLAEELRDDDEVVIRIRKRQMKADELEALPDFEGF